MTQCHRNAALALGLTAMLLPVGACRQGELSLPVTHAAASETQVVVSVEPKPTLMRAAPAIYRFAPGTSCYAFMPFRPREQRATAVQARLAQADKMGAALDAGTVIVDITGDHANILSLQAPVPWPAPPAYTARLSAIIEEYFAAPDIEDYMCNSGFARVELSALGTNDGQVHPLWTARVTSEGLLKLGADGKQKDPLPILPSFSARRAPVSELEPVARVEEVHRPVAPGTR